MADRTNSRITVIGVQRPTHARAVLRHHRLQHCPRASAEPGPGPAALAATRRLRRARTNEVGQAKAPCPTATCRDWITIYERPFDEASAAWRRAARGCCRRVRSRWPWRPSPGTSCPGPSPSASARWSGGPRVGRRAADPAAPRDQRRRARQPGPRFNEMQVKLDAVDRARREFIANASHELRTPIFSPGGFVELMQRRDPRRGDPARVPGDDEEQVKAAVEARRRPARPCRAWTPASLEFEREDVDLGNAGRRDRRRVLARHLRCAKRSSTCCCLRSRSA